MSGVNTEKFDDKYFAKKVEKKKNKGEGEFFEAEKEVTFLNSGYLLHLYLDGSSAPQYLPVLILTFRRRTYFRKRRKMIRNQWTRH